MAYSKRIHAGGKPLCRLAFVFLYVIIVAICIPDYLRERNWFRLFFYGFIALSVVPFLAIDAWREWREESVMKALLNSAEVSELDSRIATLAGAQLRFRYPMLKILLDSFSYFGLDKIVDIEKSLDEHKDEVIRFAEVRFEDRKVDSLMYGVSLLYLCYLLAGSSGLWADVLVYLRTIPFADEMLWDSIARDAVDVVASKQGTEK